MFYELKVSQAALVGNGDNGKPQTKQLRQE